MNNIIVFASGGGSNFEVIYNNTRNRKIKNTQISSLISNTPKSKAVAFAKYNNINTFIVNKFRFPDYSQYIDKLNDVLASDKPDLVVLAGYMKLIPKEITSIYKNKIINIHPAKLPEFGGKGFYGINVHKAVIESGVKNTAVTIHYVNEEYDKGIIICEEEVSIIEGETASSLSQRVLLVEHKVYSKVINNLLNE